MIASLFRKHSSSMLTTTDARQVGGGRDLESSCPTIGRDGQQATCVIDCARSRASASAAFLLANHQHTSTCTTRISTLFLPFDAKILQFIKPPLSIYDTIIIQPPSPHGPNSTRHPHPDRGNPTVPPSPASIQASPSATHHGDRRGVYVFPRKGK
jgi:hypothetical protein